jgi:hypothetical protein
MNRCIGYTKTNKKCRNILKNAKYNYFCCEEHLPYNIDILEDGCFLCMETNLKKEDLKMLKCKHLVHNSCFEEWKKHSTYDEDICIICRRELILKNEKKSDEERGYIINSKKVKINLNNKDYNYVHDYIEEKFILFEKNSKLNQGKLEFLKMN